MPLVFNHTWLPRIQIQKSFAVSWFEHALRAFRTVIPGNSLDLLGHLVDCLKQLAAHAVRSSCKHPHQSSLVHDGCLRAATQACATTQLGLQDMQVKYNTYRSGILLWLPLFLGVQIERN